MIRVTQQNCARDAKRYYAVADYYSEGQELIGCWGGKAASMLGLEGVVDKLSFERLCDNLHPTTAKPLTVRTRADRTVGYDFTFSVPKSVSLLYALSGDQGHPRRIPRRGQRDHARDGSRDENPRPQGTAGQ